MIEFHNFFLKKTLEFLNNHTLLMNIRRESIHKHTRKVKKLSRELSYFSRLRTSSTTWVTPRLYTIRRRISLSRTLNLQYDTHIKNWKSHVGINHPSFCKANTKNSGYQDNKVFDWKFLHEKVQITLDWKDDTILYQEVHLHCESDQV